MTFRDALEREITEQGLSVAEIARISRVSKGTIYNILNGKTEEARIRPATRHDIARGCNRELKILEDGGVVFVAPDEPEAPPAGLPPDGALLMVPDRPFLEAQFFRRPFDWLYEQEESGALAGIGTVDRVFQRRPDFLSVVVENRSSAGVQEVQFELRVAFEGGPSERFPLRLPVQIEAGGRTEATLFLLAGPPYHLELVRPVMIDASGQRRGLGGPVRYIYKGSCGD